MAKNESGKKTAGKKRTGTKKAGTKKAASKGGAKAPTLKKAHAAMTALFAEAPAGIEAAALAKAMPAAAAIAPGAAEKNVSFTLTNIGCVGRITSGTISFGLTGGSKIGHLFPVGVNDLFYAVKGPKNQTFAITVEGGTLDLPINSNLTPEGKAGGSRKLTVVA